MVVLLFLLSVVKFIIIQIPPGDFLTTMIINLERQGLEVSDEQAAVLRAQYGLDQPWFHQYLNWIGGLLTGDMGRSFAFEMPVSKLIGDRIMLTIVLTLITLVFTYAVAIPIGVYSATHQYSVGDYSATIFGFMGLATPDFLLALVLMFLLYKYFGLSAGGLFSPEFQAVPWSLARVWDFVKHLPVPVIVIGTASTAGMIRVMRATLLDELKKQYVITARAKGNPERRILFRYPFRVAINPMISHIGGILPALVSGSSIVAIVISLPLVGPLLLQAIMAQDMYLAGSLAMVLSTLGLIGTLISDLLLVAVDPRIRFTSGAHG